MKEIFSISELNSFKEGCEFLWQKCNGNYLAVASNDHNVRIFDRHGELIDDINLPGLCSGFGWDKDGDTLGIINDKNGVIFLYDANSRRINQIDSGFRDTLSFLRWSDIGPQLAVGTSKGNLLIYNHQTTKKVSVMGKHTKKIIDGAWSRQNLLALVGEDRMVTVSNIEGDTLKQQSVRDTPSQVAFNEMKGDERSMIGDNTVSIIVGGKTLYLFNLNDPENPFELAFQQKYGKIRSYRWFGDGYIIIGFSHGYMVVISTHLKEIGQELHQSRPHKNYLSSLDVSFILNTVASVGDNTIRVHSLADLKETYAIVDLEDERDTDKLAFTDDGQLLALSTKTGAMKVFLTKLPILGTSSTTKIAYLTSLLEITIQDDITNIEPPLNVMVDVEPSFIGLGPYHLAAGMNNRAWFYHITERGSIPVKEREYLGTVQDMKLNSDYASARFEGKLSLHLIEGLDDGENEREIRLFPDRDKKDSSITSHDLTQDFLIFGTDNGAIFYFLLEEWHYVNEYQHSSGIKNLYSQPCGSRLLFVDISNTAYIYNPVNDQIVQILNFSSTMSGILWENWPIDKDVFVGWDMEYIYTFLFIRDTIDGAVCDLVGKTKLPFGQVPVMLYNGVVTIQTQSGKVQPLHLSTHPSEKPQGMSQDQVLQAFEQCLALNRYKESWMYCHYLNDERYWKELGEKALRVLDIDFAQRVYRSISDAGMVLELSRIRTIEDQNLKTGYIATILGEYNLAQDHFLQSSSPVVALDMRRDLLHWDAALQLAKALAPDQISFISKEYAQQLEFTGDYLNSLQHFEKGITKDPQYREHDETCAGGIARTSIRMGDIRRGVNLATKLPSKVIKKECSVILEGLKQWTDAAYLYEEGEFWDRAALAYIRAKNWSKVGELLSKITSPKIHLQFAKAKEADHKYQEAAKAYANAKDWDNVIRIQLDHLQNAEEAVRVVRESQSIEGAKMVAQFFQKLNDHSTAIQFLVLSKCNEEAFQLAQEHNQMEIYADIIGSDATQNDYQSIALYFENERNNFLAGKFFFYATQYQRALKHFLRCKDSQESEAIELAIEAVAKANDSQLTHQLIDHLMGGTDDMPKDMKYLFKLYMALSQYNDAAKTALIIAREEQNAGNYRVAHDVLFQMYKELQLNKIKIPSEMNMNLMILHSYILVKIHVKRGEHLKGARLLIRVANNISKFPSHIVPILTSTVIECHRSGLKNSAFGYAAMLLRAEYRNDLDAKYKKKIEQIVRKPDKSELEETSSKCPYCDFELPDMELVCSECKNNIPYCIASGKHIVKNDLCACPNCDFLALQSEMIRLLETEDNCPMCSTKIIAANIVKITPDEQQKYLYSEETRNNSSIPNGIT